MPLVQRSVCIASPGTSVTSVLENPSSSPFRPRLCRSLYLKLRTPPPALFALPFVGKYRRDGGMVRRRFLCGGVRPATPLICQIIVEHGDQSGVVPICRARAVRGLQIA